MKRIAIIIFCVLIIAAAAEATDFDELDKPPEGAHRGQMFLGGFASIGLPYGDIIDAENKFLENNTHTFTDSEITKKMQVTHFYFSFGVSYEYMPMDIIGVKAKLRRSIIIQRTIFGTQFKNWNGFLYSDYSLFIGPSFHLTDRKQWDVTLTPVIGYALAEFEATPVGSQLISGYSGNRKQSVNGIAYGAELNFSVYFSGGLYISIGLDWTANSIKFGRDFNLTQPSGASYDGKSSTINSLTLILSAGYAFSN